MPSWVGGYLFARLDALTVLVGGGWVGAGESGQIQSEAVTLSQGDSGPRVAKAAESDRPSMTSLACIHLGCAEKF